MQEYLENTEKKSYKGLSLLDIKNTITCQNCSSYSLRFVDCNVFTSVKVNKNKTYYRTVYYSCMDRPID